MLGEREQGQDDPHHQQGEWAEHLGVPAERSAQQRGAAARERIHSRWQEFIEPGLGCRCEIQEPWVTVAESCELTLALLAAGERPKAAEVFAWLTQWRDQDGAWWTGYQLVEDMLWPDEKPTWTAGAILLAADALTGHTDASDLFLSVQEPESQQDIRQARRTRL